MMTDNNAGGTFSVDAEQGYLILEDEEGNKERFIIEEDVEVSGKKYLILCHEDEVSLGEYIALRVDEDPETGDSYLAAVEDETELTRVQEALDELDDFEEEK